MRYFTFQRIKGSIDAQGFVRWAGMAFQIEACSHALRRAVESAR